MKNRCMVFGLIVLAALIVFPLVSCSDDSESGTGTYSFGMSEMNNVTYALTGAPALANVGVSTINPLPKATALPIIPVIIAGADSPVSGLSATDLDAYLQTMVGTALTQTEKNSMLSQLKSKGYLFAAKRLEADLVGVMGGVKE